MSARSEVLALAKRKLVRPEALVQKEIIQLLRLKHVPFWRIGQRDARGTQDPGVPDIVCFPFGEAGQHVRSLLWIEVKRSDGGKWAPAQQEFARCCSETLSWNGRVAWYLLAYDPQQVADALARLGRGQGL